MRRLALALGLLAASLVLLYGRTVASLWSDWLHDDNYAHGLFIVPAAAWLVWRQRDALTALDRRPSSMGAVMVGLSLLVFLAGQTALLPFLSSVSLIGVLAGTIVHLFGWSHLRRCAVPLALLALAVPLPALLFNQVAFPLQLMASRLGVGTLDLVGVPAAREGNLLILSGTTLEVAEACSGVRSLVALATLGVFFGHLGKSGPTARVLLMASIVPIVVLVNGLRVAAAGWFAHGVGTDLTFAVLHGLSGWLFFGSAALLVFAVERGLAVIGKARPWASLGWSRS